MTLSRRRSETPTVERFFFTPEAPFDFTPGQYLRYILPHPSPDDRGTTRFFSIASAPGLPEIELATRRNQPGSTFKEALFAMKPGDKLQAAGPAGAFLLPEIESIPITMVAGGIGVTPFHAMLADRIARSSRREVTLVYGCRDRSDAPYREELEAWAAAGDGFRLVWDTDPISPETVINNRLHDSQVFVSGPAEMTQMLPQALAPRIAPQDIVSDYFPGYGTY